MATRRYRHAESNPATKRRWNLKQRYGMTPEQYEHMLAEQNNLCKLCGCPMDRPVVDHDHATGLVRGIICHPCNIKLPAIEDAGWTMLAWAYLFPGD